MQDNPDDIGLDKVIIEIGPDLTAIKTRLTQFLKNNKWSSVILMSDGHQNRAVISKPWNEDSMLLSLPSEEAELEKIIVILNNIILPEQFSAIYHVDTKLFEVIWTAFPLPENIADIAERSFEFHHPVKDTKCRFGASTSTLLEIATIFEPTGASTTNHRNLMSFSAFNIGKSIIDSGKTPPPFFPPHGSPLSFFLEDMDLTFDELSTYAMQLNFYMTYYDVKSPEILLHPRKPTVDEFQASPRFLFDVFPRQVSGKPIDDTLLHYWRAASTGDSARRFLYLYRIIEFVASYYLDRSARTSIKRLLSDPRALDNLSNITDQIVSVVKSSDMHDTTRFQHLCTELVSADTIWEEVALNKAAFTQPTSFDGSFILKTLLSNGSTQADFNNKGINNLAVSLKDIRNALSHGKDIKTNDVILPTARNFDLLRPWVSVCRLAAGQVIIYHPTL